MPSSSGKSWEWHLESDYPWRPEPKRAKSPGYSLRASTMPFDLHQEEGWSQTATWDYREEDCGYRYTVVRFDHEDGRKTYRPGRRAREASRWFHWGLPAEERIPYQLPRLRKAIRQGLCIYLVEGEKSTDAINALDVGLRSHTATTLPGGSAQWNTAPEAHRHFDGMNAITVVVDRDAAGEGWARDVVASLGCLNPPPDVYLARSRTTEPGDDVVEHLAAGHTLAELEPFELT